MKLNKKIINNLINSYKGKINEEQIKKIVETVDAYNNLDKLILATRNSKEKQVVTINSRAKLAIKSTRIYLLKLISIAKINANNFIETKEEIKTE